MTMQGEDMTDTPEETERKRKKAKSESGGVLAGIAEGASGGAALEGMGGCAEGCAGCTAVIVVMGLPVVGLLGWFGAHLIA